MYKFTNTSGTRKKEGCKINTSKIMINEFAKDIDKGLSSIPKYIPSKYFYDEVGSSIFQSIMLMPEYYLTDCEFEILSNYSEEIVSIFIENSGKVNLMEFGAGDGLKTKILLKAMLERNMDFTYYPIDISEKALDKLINDLNGNLRGLSVEGINSDYFSALHQLQGSYGARNIVLFLGSNIGNFSNGEDISFLRKLNQNLNPGDLVMIGFDLMKSPNIILEAYNDKNGTTMKFNMNLLDRINKELNANFDLSKFDHFPIYDPVTGEAKSYIISKCRQSVFIESIGKEFTFEEAEPIFTEVSRKYSLKDIKYLAEESGFSITADFFDHKKYFADYIWKK